MFGKDRVPRYPRQVWFVVLMALILLALVASIALGLGPRPRAAIVIKVPATPTVFQPTVTPTWTPIFVRMMPSVVTGTLTVTPTLTLTVTPRHTAITRPSLTATRTITPTAVPTPTPRRTSSATPSPVPTLTLTPTATITPTLTVTPTERAAEDHYWLERPIGPDGANGVAHFYAYASRADGTYPIHHGVEFVNPMGTPILATAPGTIIVAGDDKRQVYGARNDFYGLLVVEQLDQMIQGQPVYVLYGHLSEVNVQVGQKVTTGDLIGLVGMTGVAEGPHLHLEVRYGANEYGKTVNPELWLRPFDGRGTLAGVVLAPDGRPLPEVRVVFSRANTPEKVARDLLTYPAKEVNPDPAWGENWVAADLEAGEWIVRVYYKQRLYTEKAVVQPGKTTWLTIRMAN